PRVAGTVHAENLEIAASAEANPELVLPAAAPPSLWAPHRGTLEASLRWSGGRYHPIEIASLTGKAEAVVQNLPPVRASWSGRGTGDPVGGAVAIDAATIDVADLVTAQIEGRGTLFGAGPTPTG